MRRTFVSCSAICFSIAFTGPGQAQNIANDGPSYSCDGRLNAVEQRICDDPLLSMLDREMADDFVRTYDGLSRRNQVQLREEQLLWLRWRNACDLQSSCLRRRYEQRIIDLAGATVGTPPPSGGTSAGEIVERRIRNGNYETVYGDGRIEWQSVGGESMGTIFPDGTGTSSFFSQAPGAGFPALPDANQEWANSVEASLLGMIDNWFSPEDRTEYRDIIQGRPITERVLGHINVLGHLAGQ